MYIGRGYVMMIIYVIILTILNPIRYVVRIFGKIKSNYIYYNIESYNKMYFPKLVFYYKFIMYTCS